MKRYLKNIGKTLLYISMGVFFFLSLFYNPDLQPYLFRKIVRYAEQKSGWKISYDEMVCMFPFDFRATNLQITNDMTDIAVGQLAMEFRWNRFCVFDGRLNLRNVNFANPSTTVQFEKFELDELTVDVLNKAIRVDSALLEKGICSIETAGTSTGGGSFGWNVSASCLMVDEMDLLAHDMRFDCLNVRLFDMEYDPQMQSFYIEDCRLSCPKAMDGFVNMDGSLNHVVLGKEYMMADVSHVGFEYLANEINMSGGIYVVPNENMEATVIVNVGGSRMDADVHTDDWQVWRMELLGDISGNELKGLNGKMPEWGRLESFSLASELDYRAGRVEVRSVNLNTDLGEMSMAGWVDFGGEWALQRGLLSYEADAYPLKWLCSGTLQYADSVVKIDSKIVESADAAYFDAEYDLKNEGIKVLMETSRFNLNKLLGKSWGNVKIKGFCQGVGSNVRDFRGFFSAEIDTLEYGHINYGKIFLRDSVAYNTLNGIVEWNNAMFSLQSNYRWKPDMMETDGYFKIFAVDTLAGKCHLYLKRTDGGWCVRTYLSDLENKLGDLGDVCVSVYPNEIQLYSGDMELCMRAEGTLRRLAQNDWTDFLHRKGDVGWSFSMNTKQDNLLSKILKQKGISWREGTVDVSYQGDLFAQIDVLDLKWNEMYVDTLTFRFRRDRFDLRGKCLSVMSGKCVDLTWKGWLEGNRMYSYVSDFPVDVLSEMWPKAPSLQGMASVESMFDLQDGVRGTMLKIRVDSLASRGEGLGDWQFRLDYERRRDFRLAIERDAQKVAWMDAYLETNWYRVWLQDFPLSIANTFLPPNTVQLSGLLSGNLDEEDGFREGRIRWDDARLLVIPIGTTYIPDSNWVEMYDGEFRFRDYRWTASDGSVIWMNGTVDSRLDVDLDFRAQNFQVIDAEKPRGSMFTGEAYVDVDARLTGHVTALSLGGQADLLNSSVVQYHVRGESVPKSFDQMIHYVTRDSIPLLDTLVGPLSEGFSMQVQTQIEGGAQIVIDLSMDARNQITVKGAGNLLFSLSPQGQKTLSGKYGILSGTVKYNIPIVGEKIFSILDGGMIDWTGNVNNPNMNIVSQLPVRVSVMEDNGNSRIVTFDVHIRLSGDMQHPRVDFDVQIPNDLLLQSRLAAYSQDEKTRIALNLLIYGTYNESMGSSDVSNNALNSFVENELNQWSRRYFGEMGLTFGVNSYSRMDADGQELTQTDYSYSYSRALFDDRINVKIGGRVSTGQKQSAGYDQTPIDNIGLEYLFPKHKHILLKAFRQETYESAFDGDVTRTGVGIVWRKDFWHLMDIFRCKRGD